MLNEQDFIMAILPRGYHVSAAPILSLMDVTTNTTTSGSIPVDFEQPWYAGLDEATDEDTDIFTAWLYTAHMRAGVQLDDLDPQNMCHVAAFMSADLVRFKGVTADTLGAIAAIAAVVVGGAAYIKTYGHTPLDAEAFVMQWLEEQGE